MPEDLFGSSDRSNFILNLKPEAFRRYTLGILLGFLLLVQVLSVPSELFGITTLPPAALTIAGSAALLFALIGLVRGFLPKQILLPAGFWLALAVWSLVSAACSFHTGDPLDDTTALLGADGRGEGALSILFSGCLFLLGASLGTSEKRRLLHWLLLSGLFQCGWGLLQALPVGFPSFYQNLEPLLEYRVFLPSGLTGSPIFFASLLVLLECPAMFAAAFTEHPKKRIVYLICTAAFALMAVKTQCLIGVIGAPLGVLLGAICLLRRKAGKQGTTVILTAVIALCAGLGWWFAAPSVNGTYNNDDPSSASVLTLYDGSVMWKDSSYRLDVTGYYIPAEDASPHGTFDLKSIPSVYGFLWGNTADIIRQHPLTGTGPDSLVYAQLFNSLYPADNPNTFDRAYNWYLHTAATLGIPALLLLTGILAAAVLRGFRGSIRGDWMQTAFLGAVLLYCTVMIAGSSCAAVTPLFWMLAGACGSMEKKET